MKYNLFYHFFNTMIIYFLCTSALHSSEFLYPVAVAEKNKMYVVYQKSFSHLELWIWDSATKKASKGLLSSYTPAGLKLIPGGLGFSFIDNGRIKIKKYNKRSPQSIDIYEPIYNINLIEWLDQNSFYLSAKKNGNFSFFQMDTKGSIELMIKDKGDIMYPQKIGNDLFYIERIIKKGVYKRDYLSYKVMRLDYLHCLADINGVPVCAKDASQVEQQEIINFRSCPIAFLKMISHEHGFFLEHPSEADKQDRTVPFSYYEIKKVDGAWTCKEIFQFTIPSYLILNTSEFRLYESMLPMLPRYNNGKIYYVDCLDDQHLTLDIFCYDFQADDVDQKTTGKEGSIAFSPICIGDSIFYGCSIPNEDDIINFMWIDTEGDVYIDLPKM